MDTLADLERYVASLSGDEKRELDQMLAPELKALWLPEPANEPQVQAYVSQADLLLYGGAAGAGKTDLVVGLALTDHEKSVIFRRQSKDLRGIEERLIEIAGRDGWNGSDQIMRRDDRVIELGHLEKPGSELSWQGRPHDYIGLDEGAQLGKAKVEFVLGWLRSSKPGQRRRAVIASNPPTGGEGEWIIEWFAPWLDEKFSNSARPGELRWAATAPDREHTTVWLPDGSPIVFEDGNRNWRKATPQEIEAAAKNEIAGHGVVEPLTRTFIPGRLHNNPYLANTGYRARLQNMPEPLRSQLLNGSFTAGRVDHEWQVIPTAWVKAAQARWTPRPPGLAAMTAIGVDVAQGGADDSTLAPRHGPWYAPVISRPGVETPKPSDVAGMVVTVRRNGAVVVVDMGGGYGGGVKERLDDNDIKAVPYNGANDSKARTMDGSNMPFVNRRAEVHWRFREALNPDQDGGSQIALPPDPQVLADLTAPRWKLTARGIQIEDKEELKKPERLGRSPDKGDAIVIAWSEGEKAIIARLKMAQREAKKAVKPAAAAVDLPAGSGWMGV